MNLLSVFGGGLWLIPVGLFLAAAWSAYRGIRASKSGSRRQNTATGEWIETPGNEPFYNTGGGLLSIILFAVLIVVIILMVNDK